MRVPPLCFGIEVIIADGKVEVFLVLLRDRSLELACGRCARRHTRGRGSQRRRSQTRRRRRLGSRGWALGQNPRGKRQGAGKDDK